MFSISIILSEGNIHVIYPQFGVKGVALYCLRAVKNPRRGDTVFKGVIYRLRAAQMYSDPRRASQDYFNKTASLRAEQQRAKAWRRLCLQ